jgi:hypothetical protein
MQCVLCDIRFGHLGATNINFVSRNFTRQDTPHCHRAERKNKYHFPPVLASEFDNCYVILWAMVSYLLKGYSCLNQN